MKNKYLFAFLFAFIAISTTAFSQINCGTKDQIKQFMASETYFVDDLARNKYNDAVDKVLDSCWSVTSADKMTPEEFEKQFNNKKFSFVYLSVNT
ncbi:MAG: hypothetical protein Q8880_03435, partial [Bacteroidota bacterium]|nr:hypothetical protein [Bacteroidota bacterium]